MHSVNVEEYLTAFRNTEHQNITMKVVFVLLVCLPFLFANTADEDALKAYKRMTPEERLSVHQAYESIKHWLASHGTAMSAGTCSVVCASATALETLGLSAPLCAAACALIGLIG